MEERKLKETRGGGQRRHGPRLALTIPFSTSVSEASASHVTISCYENTGFKEPSACISHRLNRQQESTRKVLLALPLAPHRAAAVVAPAPLHGRPWTLS